ncbi:MAG: endonuclease/exonuclease/phosphatase family protein, partial [Nanoarchaeota archaeon]
MVRLIVYNIEYCEGISGLWWQYLEFWKIFFPPKGMDQRIVEQLKKLKPDILALVEVDTGSFRTKKDEVVFFEKKLGMKNFIEKIKYPFEGWLKLFHYVPILNKQANAIIAKERLSKVRYHVFHEGTKRVVIEATIHVPKKVTLLLAHLALGKKARAKQIQELTKIVNSIKNPVILMGDFNTFNGEKEIKILLKETHLHHRF